MKILLLAPQQFFQTRGTPIAVDLVLKSLSESGHQIDLVTFPGGENTAYENVNIYRTPKLFFINEIPPGFSWGKISCDFFLLFKALRLAIRQDYDVVHAVEESAFFGVILKIFLGIPYIYDMDSSLVQQLLEKYRYLRGIRPILEVFERIVVKQAYVVIPVCDTLAQDIQDYKPSRVVTIPDISLLNYSSPVHSSKKDINPPVTLIRKTLQRADSVETTILMYVGNLAQYQGIDLMLESFATVIRSSQEARLVVVGGQRPDIERYQRKSEKLGISENVCFLGPRPIEQLSAYLSQADILVSPRIQGKNTPMKLFSYLASGKPVLATDLPTHTCVLTSQIAMLAEPSPKAFGASMLKLIKHRALRSQLGTAGQQFVEQNHSYKVFQQQFNCLYNSLQTELIQA